MTPSLLRIFIQTLDLSSASTVHKQVFLYVPRVMSVEADKSSPNDLLMVIILTSHWATERKMTQEGRNIKHILNHLNDNNVCFDWITIIKW